MTMRTPSGQPRRRASQPARPTDQPGHPATRGAVSRHASRFLTAGLLGVAAAGLVACGSTGKGLIPAADAGPLQTDFEEVAQAAEAGNGDCTATKEAIAKTEADFQALPSTVDPGLHARLRVGIANLSLRAREMCQEPSAGATTTATTTSSTHTTTRATTTTTTTTTQSTPTSTSTTTTPTATIPAPGGGTPAPGESGGTPGSSNGNGNGQGNGESNGTGVGGTGVGSGQGNGQGNNGQGNGQ
jgi:hypothetical protein